MIKRVLLFAVLLLPGIARADNIRVVSSGGFAAAYKVLAPEFERQTGHHLVTDWGPSMGTTPNAVPQRMARGEPIDVVIMVGYALDKLVDSKAAQDPTPLARSLIGMAVKAGAPVPDISTEAKLRQVLLDAKSVAYSDSASGVYIENEMFKKMGIAEQMHGKARMIPADPVGGVVAKGEAEIGFQQISELQPVPGITVVGPIPDSVQLATVFSGGVLTGSAHKAAAESLLRFLSGPQAADAVRASGMEPITAGGK